MSDPRPSREERPLNAPFNQGVGRPARPSIPAYLSQTSQASATSKSDSLKGFSDNTADVPHLLTGNQSDRHGISFAVDAEEQPHAGTSNENMRRKRSLVRPDRERIDPSHPLYNYRTHAAALQVEGGHVGLSRTGAYPQAGIGLDAPASHPPLRRGVSILAREQDTDTDTGAGILQRGATLRRKRGAVGRTEELAKPDVRKGPLSPWMIYVRIITCCCPAPMLRAFGMSSQLIRLNEAL